MTEKNLANFVRADQTTKTHQLLKYYNKIVKHLSFFKTKKQFNLFWNKLTNKDRKLVILLLGANNNEPIPSLTHLKSELFLIKHIYYDKWTYGSLE